MPPDDYSPGEKADLSVACSFRPGSKKGQFLRRNSNGTWAAPKSLGGAVTGVASCIAPSATTRTCFFQGSNRTLQRIYFNGTGWSAWQNLGGALYSAPSCVWFAGAETHCFAVGADGKLQQKRKGGGGWQPWAS